MAHIKPKKSLGQNFLTDKNIINKIVGALDIPAGGKLLEIGPGTGALTERLAEKDIHLTAVDLDQRAIAELQAKLPTERYPNTRIIHGDFLSMDLAGLAGDDGLYVIGNIPYYISGRIFYKIFESANLIKEVVLMVQKEVAQRICAKKKTKDYGILTVAANLCGEAKILFDVSRSCFYPRPNVTSSVIKLTLNKEHSDIDFNDFMSLVKSAFNQRRKKLSNSLKKYIEARGVGQVGKLRPYLDKRAEELSFEDFLEIFRTVNA